MPKYVHTVRYWIDNTTHLAAFFDILGLSYDTDSELVDNKPRALIIKIQNSENITISFRQRASASLQQHSNFIQHLSTHLQGRPDLPDFVGQNLVWSDQIKQFLSAYNATQVDIWQDVSANLSNLRDRFVAELPTGALTSIGFTPNGTRLVIELGGVFFRIQKTPVD